jgi:hypothetical protein
VVDLRKCGFVPVAGLLQTSGIVHHMTLDGVVDPAAGLLLELEAAQPTLPLAPSALNRGESCSDPIGRLGAMAGAPLDGDFARRLSREFGGSRGCSHLLTLAQLFGSSLAWALGWERRQPASASRRRPGEEVFHRALLIDGCDREEGIMDLAIQLTDVHFAAAKEIALPMERFGAQREVRVRASVDFEGGLVIGEIAAAERIRASREAVETAAWRDRSDELQFLLGQSVMRGISPRLLDAFGGEPGDRPLLDALLNLAPGFIQCLASLSEDWPAAAMGKPSLLGVCGRPDSCHMWRDGGALQQVAVGEGKSRGAGGGTEPEGA